VVLLALLPALVSSAPATPALFGAGTISTGDMELNAAFTPDGRTLFFTKRSPKPQYWVIVVSHLRGGRWSAPEVAGFSGQYNDFDPFVSPDGATLYFSSNRPVDGRPKTDFDIWAVDRTAAGWGAPRHLDAPVNTAAQEYYPTVTRDGTLYFSSTRDGGAGAGDIYRATRVDGRYAEPENLGDSVNARNFDGDPYIAPDESYLLFVSYGRAGGSGDGDLYLSVRRAGVWSRAENLGPGINSSALDFCPIVSPDGKTLFFTSERGFADAPQSRRLTAAELARRLHAPGNGFGDIYRIDAAAVLSRVGGR
jgi:Tol biopolymer transport system component